MTDPKDPDFIWKMVQECGEQERHFNTIQGIYRGLASTWLLAMFGGIGYILGKPYPMHLLTALLGLALVFGIALLWMLDVLVYHRLLLAAFEEGKNLEDAHAWLPRIRTRMREGDRHEKARQCATWFYIGVALAGALVCAVEVAQVLLPTSRPAAVAAFAAIMAAFVALARHALQEAAALTTAAPSTEEEPAAKPRAAGS